MSMLLQTNVEALPISSFTPARNGLLQRRCACGRHIVAGGECAECHKKRLARQRGSVNQVEPTVVPPIVHDVLHSPGRPLDPASHTYTESHFAHDFSRIPAHTHSLWRGPAKALDAVPSERDEEKPSPRQGSATIQCNGSGDYEIVYNGWAGATCGTKACVTAHESSHIADWKAKWSTGCSGQPKGYLPKGDPPDSPLMTAAEYKAFLKESECKAHTVDLNCAQALPKPAGCKTTVEDYIKLTESQKANYCPSLSTAAKVAIGAGGGALVGAGIGALAGGPVGALIGAGIGALVGGVAGAFF